MHMEDIEKKIMASNNVKFVNKVYKMFEINLMRAICTFITIKRQIHFI